MPPWNSCPSDLYSATGGFQIQLRVPIQFYEKCPGEPGDHEGHAYSCCEHLLGAHFEIKVDGVPRLFRDVRETAIEAARFLAQVATADRGREPRPALFTVCLKVHWFVTLLIFS